MRTLTPAALILWLVLVCIGLLADAGSTRAAPAYSVVFSGSQTITVTPGETFTATLLLDLDGESSIQQGVSLTFDEELQDLLDIVSITPLGVPPYNFTIEPSPVDSVLRAAGTITGFPVVCHRADHSGRAIRHRAGRVPPEDSRYDQHQALLLRAARGVFHLQDPIPNVTFVSGTVAVLSPTTIAVEIDIKPGSDVNAINPLGQGLIPVALLGAIDVDVMDVDPETLAFGPDGAPTSHEKGPHVEDVNDDGFTDLVVHFRIQETGIAFGQDEACVTGETLDGTPIEGCDSIVTVGSCGIGFELVLVLPALMWLYRSRRRNRAGGVIRSLGRWSGGAGAGPSGGR